MVLDAGKPAPGPDGVQVAEALARDERVGESRVDRVGGIHRPARQREVLAGAARGVREQPRPAHVGREADAGLGHGQPGALGDDADGCVTGQTDAAAVIAPMEDSLAVDELIRRALKSFTRGK